MSRRLDTVKSVDVHSTKQFRYGSMDCCLFAIEVAKDVTNNDHGDKFRSKYSTKDEARQLIAKGGGMQEIVSSILGEPIDVDQTLDGDPILVSYPLKFDDDILGVRLGDHIVLKTARHVTRIELKCGIVGWRA